MNDWAAGYRAALADVGRLLRSRDLLDDVRIGGLLADLAQDALVIEHEQGNKLQKRRLAAAREALPLFEDKP